MGVQYEVLHSTSVRSLAVQHEERGIVPRHVRETDNERWMILSESLFQND